jgi:hypothetical protein
MCRSDDAEARLEQGVVLQQPPRGRAERVGRGEEGAPNVRVDNTSVSRTLYIDR